MEDGWMEGGREGWREGWRMNGGWVEDGWMDRLVDIMMVNQTTLSYD